MLAHPAEMLALVDAADERDRLAAVIPCDERYTEPYDFAYCEAHDRPYLRNARTTASVTVSPRRSASAFAACHTSSGTRTERGGVCPVPAGRVTRTPRPGAR